MPERCDLKMTAVSEADGQQTLHFESEPGLPIIVKRTPIPNSVRLAILVDLDNGADASLSAPLARQLREAGWMVAAPELRATGRFAVARDTIGRAPDHNTAEWSLWLGRPLLGQWAWDVQRVLDAIKEQDARLPMEITVIGNRDGGVVALCAAALDSRVSRVVTVNSLASFVTDQPYTGHRLGLMAPAILRDVGDIPHLAALIAPRPVVVAGGVDGTNRPLSPGSLRDSYRFTEDAFGLGDTGDQARFVLTTAEQLPQIFK